MEFRPSRNSCLRFLPDNGHRDQQVIVSAKAVTLYGLAPSYGIYPGELKSVDLSLISGLKCVPLMLTVNKILLHENSVGAGQR